MRRPNGRKDRLLRKEAPTESFNYQRYLASREWGVLKRQVRERSGSMCERGHLQPVQGEAVHHMTYERIGHELLDDLLHVCRPCHEYLSGNIDRDPIEAEVDAADWSNSPWAARIVTAYALIDWLAPRDSKFTMSPILLAYLKDTALTYGYEPKAIVAEAIDFFVNSQRDFDPEGRSFKDILKALDDLE